MEKYLTHANYFGVAMQIKKAMIRTAIDKLIQQYKTEIKQHLSDAPEKKLLSSFLINLLEKFSAYVLNRFNALIDNEAINDNDDLLASAVQEELDYCFALIQNTPLHHSTIPGVPITRFLYKVSQVLDPNVSYLQHLSSESVPDPLSPLMYDDIRWRRFALTNLLAVLEVYTSYTPIELYNSLLSGTVKEKQFAILPNCLFLLYSARESFEASFTEVIARGVLDEQGQFFSAKDRTHYQEELLKAFQKLMRFVNATEKPNFSDNQLINILNALEVTRLQAIFLKIYLDSSEKFLNVLNLYNNNNTLRSGINEFIKHSTNKDPIFINLIQSVQSVGQFLILLHLSQDVINELAKIITPAPVWRSQSGHIVNFKRKLLFNDPSDAINPLIMALVSSFELLRDVLVMFKPVPEAMEVILYSVRTKLATFPDRSGERIAVVSSLLNDSERLFFLTILKKSPRRLSKPAIEIKRIISRLNFFLNNDECRAHLFPFYKPQLAKLITSIRKLRNCLSSLRNDPYMQEVVLEACSAIVDTLHFDCIRFSYHWLKTYKLLELDRIQACWLKRATLFLRYCSQKIFMETLQYSSVERLFMSPFEWILRTMPRQLIFSWGKLEIALFHELLKKPRSNTDVLNLFIGTCQPTFKHTSDLQKAIQALDAHPILQLILLKKNESCLDKVSLQEAYSKLTKLINSYCNDPQHDYVWISAHEYLQHEAVQKAWLDVAAAFLKRCPSLIFIKALKHSNFELRKLILKQSPRELHLKRFNFFVEVLKKSRKDTQKTEDLELIQLLITTCRPIVTFTRKVDLVDMIAVLTGFRWLQWDVLVNNQSLLKQLIAKDCVNELSSIVQKLPIENAKTLANTNDKLRIVTAIETWMRAERECFGPEKLIEIFTQEQIARPVAPNRFIFFLHQTLSIP